MVTQTRSRKPVLVPFAQIKRGQEIVLHGKVCVKVKDKVAMDTKGVVYEVRNSELVKKK